jgi:hypothetical protein
VFKRSVWDGKKEEEVEEERVAYRIIKEKTEYYRK